MFADVLRSRSPVKTQKLRNKECAS